jgi:general secretion pathway protein G
MSEQRSTGGNVMRGFDREAGRLFLRPGRAAAAGFTLLEVMIVLALIGLIAGSIGVAVFNQFKKGQVKVAKATVSEISGAVQQYMMENNSECPRGMEDLIAKKNLKKAIKDPWGKDFIVKCPGQNDTDGADVLSTGPDKQEGTPDDIKSWE